MGLYPWYYDDASGSVAVAPLSKGGEQMPITLTFHFFGFVITVRVKSKNRHRAG